MSRFKSYAGLAILIFGITFSLLAVNVKAQTESEVTPPKKPSTKKQLTVEDIKRFSAAISQIKNYYVKDVKDKKLFDDAIRGMLAGLDPHSAYLNPEDFKDLTDSSRGEFGGLGMEVTIENGILKVISPLDDTPAHKAGVKAGDYIIRIDDHPVQDLTLRQAVNLIRGKIGTEVKITILRKGSEKPIILSVKREIIEIKTVKSKLFDGKYGYLRITHFQSPTYKNVLKAVKKLKKEANKGLEGLIIDLRNNPGGLLDSAIEISDAFVNNDAKGEEERIVFTRGRVSGSEFMAFATAGDIMKDKPIVVLINNGSASGSEILAGALQDNKRAIIVGERSFGKGSVQTVIPLDNHSGIKLTTALYYTPSGTSIQAKGIIPDIEIREVHVPKPAEDDGSMKNVSEADLRGHLDNNSQKKELKKAKLEEEKKTSSLIYKDYQLHEAFNILKSLVLTKRATS